MKLYRKVFFMALLYCVTSFPLYAQNSWFKEGQNVLNSLNGNKKSALPSDKDIAQAFQEALTIGAKFVITKLSQNDGFNKDQVIRIHLPKSFNKVTKLMAKVGMSKEVMHLEIKLNKAAEVATPQAKKLFLYAIQSMRFKDIQKIYKGKDNAATLYFRQRMQPDLEKSFRPIIQKSLNEVGAIKLFKEIMKRYNGLPFVNKVKIDLTEHVLTKALDGLFYYLAKEEAAIRKDPKKQISALLKKVFG